MMFQVNFEYCKQTEMLEECKPAQLRYTAIVCPFIPLGISTKSKAHVVVFWVMKATYESSPLLKPETLKIK
jgi:hypothetical protein